MQELYLGVTSLSRLRDIFALDDFLARQPHRHKIVIAGNHDFCFERQPEAAEALVPTGVTYLRDAGLFTMLQRFQMEGFFGPAEARILVAGKLYQLTTLQLIGMADLSEAESDVLGDAGLEVLIAPPMFAQVESLELPMHGIGDRGAAILAGSPQGKRLRRLDLRGNSIGDDGARALMNGTYTRNLVHLGLADTLISDDMADELRAHYGPRVLLRE